MTSWRSRAALLITHVDDTDLQYCVWVRWQDGKPSPRTDESQTKYRCTLRLTIPYPGTLVPKVVRVCVVGPARACVRGVGRPERVVWWCGAYPPLVCCLVVQGVGALGCAVIPAGPPAASAQ